MTGASLFGLATLAGIATAWKDVFGVTHDVTPDTLRAVLASLGFPAETEAQITASSAHIRAPLAGLPPLLTGDVGIPISLPVSAAPYQLRLEDGRVYEGMAEGAGGLSTIPAILEAGYHCLEIGGSQTLLAIAPWQGFTAPEAMGRAKGWGLAVQLYALRHQNDAGLGDFAALAQLAAPAARYGAQALAISPAHAQFSADPDRFSPYAPSSRSALNILHAPIDTANPALSAGELVDWPAASRYRLNELRRMFIAARNDQAEMAAFEAFRDRQGDRLLDHAVFETLHAHFFSSSEKFWHWTSWPVEFQDARSQAVKLFAQENDPEISFHAWAQFRADRGLAKAQQACKAAGMGIGLISDLAVGTDSGGSQCWSRQNETLLGLTVGAPPDLLQRDGQNWGLTAFSPTGLCASGFTTFRDMLDTALAHAGGMRVDHAMGLNRLWVIPEGASGGQGAYLTFPEKDLLRLIRLESQRRRAVVLAEDLGTVPEGFQDRLRESGIEGMRILWFERDNAQNFVSPRHWTPRAAAMTSTHDLPTLAGWWSARDIEWRHRVGQESDLATALKTRADDRRALWDAMCHAGAACHPMPDESSSEIFAEAACRHVGASACELVILPLEDALARVDQPNLPGTLDQHPNWRRRMPENTEILLDAGATPQRLAALSEARQH